MQVQQVLQSLVTVQKLPFMFPLTYLSNRSTSCVSEDRNHPSDDVISEEPRGIYTSCVSHDAGDHGTSAVDVSGRPLSSATLRASEGSCQRRMSPVGSSYVDVNINTATSLFSGASSSACHYESNHNNQGYTRTTSDLSLNDSDFDLN